jgi:hypothetical protein
LCASGEQGGGVVGGMGSVCGGGGAKLRGLVRFPDTLLCMPLWSLAMKWGPRLRATLKWLGLCLAALVLVGYVFSAFRSVGWEGPSDWAVNLESGQLSISMTNIGREHFRGPYGRGWWVDDAGRSMGWSLDDSVDYGPYSVMVFPMWVPLLLIGLPTLMVWNPFLIPKRATVRWLLTGFTIFVAASPWLLIVTALPAALLWLQEIPAARRRARLRAGQCATCGYDRRGLAADAKCPECGAT